MALEHHYQYLKKHTKRNFFEGVLRNEMVVWKDANRENGISIALTFPYAADHEGDLAFLASFNSRPLCIISFSIIPGALLRETDEHILFIGRVQGLAAAQTIRDAAKSCQDVAAPALLIAAVEGLAKAFGINKVVGVSLFEQLSNGESKNERSLIFDYDVFWSTLQAEKKSGHFHLQIPLIHKPLESVSAAHRRRARLKRAFKKKISDAVTSYISAHCLKKGAVVVATHGLVGSTYALIDFFIPSCIWCIA